MNGDPSAKEVAPGREEKRLEALLHQLSSFEERLRVHGANLCNTADRLLGMEPTDPSPTTDRPQPECILAKIAQVVDDIRNAFDKAAHEADRLDTL